jgi:hypothetical protein
MLNALLVAPVSPVAAAVNLYPVPAWLTLKSLNEASPETAFFVVEPLRVPPPGLAPIPIVIYAVDDATVLPRLSCTVIVGGPEMLLPTLALPGCVVKASAAAAPAELLNALLVAAASPAEDAVKV